MATLRLGLISGTFCLAAHLIALDQTAAALGGGDGRQPTDVVARKGRPAKTRSTTVTDPAGDLRRPYTLLAYPDLDRGLTIQGNQIHLDVPLELLEARDGANWKAWSRDFTPPDFILDDLLDASWTPDLGATVSGPENPELPAFQDLVGAAIGPADDSGRARFSWTTRGPLPSLLDPDTLFFTELFGSTVTEGASVNPASAVNPNQWWVFRYESPFPYDISPFGDILAADVQQSGRTTLTFTADLAGALPSSPTAGDPSFAWRVDRNLDGVIDARAFLAFDPVSGTYRAEAVNGLVTTPLTIRSLGHRVEITGDAAYFGVSGDFQWDFATALRTSLSSGRYQSPALDRVPNSGLTAGSFAGCPPSTLCLHDGRYELEVAWTNQFDGSTGTGLAGKLTDATGYFSFTNPDNVELLVKVLDFGGGTVKLFYGQLTNLHFELRVRDTTTGRVKTYQNGPGDCGDIDQSFEQSFTGTADVLAKRLGRRRGATGTCVANANTLCLLDKRFAVRVAWRNQFNNTSGSANPRSISDLSGVFDYGDASNVELLVKTLDFGDRILFFYGALSDLEYGITVTDTLTGAVESFFNPAGTYCGGLDENLAVSRP